MRWATVILNALKMMKLPTKSAMAAKPSRKLRKMSTNCLNWSLASLEAVSPVMASYPAGSTVWIAARERRLAHARVGRGADGGEAVLGVEDPLRRRGA